MSQLPTKLGYLIANGAELRTSYGYRSAGTPVVIDACITTSAFSSDGASLHVPLQFLLQELPSSARRNRFTLGALQEPELAGEEVIDGVDCDIVRARHPNGAPYRVWLGQEDALVRKIETTIPLSTNATIPSYVPKDAGQKITEIHRDIQTDRDLPDAKFAFPATEAPGSGR